MVRGGLRVLNKNSMPESVIGSKKSYSTLKAMTKDELIELLGIAQHNYECVNESYFIMKRYAEKLDKALDRACEKLTKHRICNSRNLKMDNNGEIDCNFENHDCKKCWREYLMKGEEE